MKTGAGSYESGPAGAMAREAARLKRQAAAIWAREREALVGAGLTPGQRCLDVGCGPGDVLGRIAGVVGCSPFGVDLSQTFLGRAGTVAHVARADGADLPFRDGVFDFVLFRLVLRHAPLRARLLREAARVVRVGGTVAALDIDEGATALDPEPPGWPALKVALATSAARRGGDPFVGRRLRRLLLECGLANPVAVALPITTEDLPPAAFVETVLAPAARTVDPDLLAAATVQRSWDELRQWAAGGVGFGYAVGLMAAARKPDDWDPRALT
jgi:SAM-dependent methyltransferase